MRKIVSCFYIVLLYILACTLTMSVKKAIAKQTPANSPLPVFDHHYKAWALWQQFSSGADVIWKPDLRIILRDFKTNNGFKGIKKIHIDYILSLLKPKKKQITQENWNDFFDEFDRGTILNDDKKIRKFVKAFIRQNVYEQLKNSLGDVTSGSLGNAYTAFQNHSKANPPTFIVPAKAELMTAYNKATGTTTPTVLSFEKYGVYEDMQDDSYANTFTSTPIS
jgi:hypothetical protein